MSVEHVKTLTNGCQVHIQAKPIGQTLDMEIQDLSTLCPIKYNDETSPNRQSLDQPWTWTNLGQTLDLDEPWTNSTIDKVWTNLGLISQQTKFGQTLDLDKPWKNMGF